VDKINAHTYKTYKEIRRYNKKEIGCADIYQTAMPLEI
jgi:hypothetical protein